MPEESRPEEYNIDTIFDNMDEEAYGIHISLIESGLTQSNKKKMSIVMNSNLGKEKIIEIFKEIVRGYENMGGETKDVRNV